MLTKQYDENHYIVTGKQVREMLETHTQLCLMEIIDWNMENNPKPHHMNKELMKTALQLPGRPHTTTHATGRGNVRAIIGVLSALFLGALIGHGVSLWVM